MPNNYDFSKLDDIKTIEVNPEGWISPLYVEYSLGNHIETPSYFWRVKGTLHTFIIPIVRMDYLSSGDYKKHFENVLENFREDYLTWKEERYDTDWAREYFNQYSRFIVI